MINSEFYKNFKKCLESEYFTEILLSKGDINSDERRLFLVKAIYFLISTRDFNGFEQILNQYYRNMFPYEYIKQKENLTDDQVKAFTYNNFIKEGFLFHITPSYNVNDILTSGLKTLNDKYSCDLYNKSLELNRIYCNIRDRNSNLDKLFKMKSLITIPGFSEYQEERFKTVYLSSNLDYILKTYGESGELFNFFINDLLWVFNNWEEYSFLTKDELKNKIAMIINNSGAKIFEEEKNIILDYIDIIYEDKRDDSIDDTKSILLVPTKSIVSDSTAFYSIYEENRLNLDLETILDFADGEIICNGSIEPENIISINCNRDKSLSLKIKDDFKYNG